ncbi:hypothetical protein [Borreliella burgdorferi]|uniref:hypothetical protein n=1 Tax=Borreliella burgdorferi TaxID=139 RepID=UPI003DA6CD48
MTKIIKQINIIGSIAAVLIISISGIGTYAFKGILSDLKTEVFKIKTEIFSELENYYNAKFKNEFEEMKNSIKEDFKKNTDLVNSINKENLVLEVGNILSKERIKIQELLREEIEKFLNSIKLEKINE